MSAGCTVGEKQNKPRLCATDMGKVVHLTTKCRISYGDEPGSVETANRAAQTIWPQHSSKRLQAGSARDEPHSLKTSSPAKPNTAWTRKWRCMVYAVAARCPVLDGKTMVKVDDKALPDAYPVSSRLSFS